MIKEFEISEILNAVDTISKMQKRKSEIVKKSDSNNKDDVLTLNKQVKSNKSDVLVLNEMIE